MSSVTDTYFPNLVEILKRDPSATERLKLDCGLCFEEMTTDGVSRWERPDGERGISHVAFILPCGHMFGLSCVENLRQHSREQHSYGRCEHRCPVCRGRQHFLPCGCPHSIGTVFNLEDATSPVVMEKFMESKTLFDRCLVCELTIFAGSILEEVDPSGGVETDNVSWHSPSLGGQVTIQMQIMIAKRSKDVKWRFDAFRIGKRIYAPSDIGTDTRRKMDEFIDYMSPFFNGKYVQSGDEIDRFVAEVMKSTQYSRVCLTQVRE